MLAFGTAHAETRFDAEQRYVLSYAYAYGSQFTTKGYFKHNPDSNHLGYVMAAIAWQESSAGKQTGDHKNGHPAHGIFQNYDKTVETKLKRRNLWKGEANMIAMLSTDSGSAYWAMDELKYWIWRRGNIRDALASYYAGNSYKEHYWYADAVITKLKYLKRFKYEHYE